MYLSTKQQMLDDARKADRSNLTHRPYYSYRHEHVRKPAAPVSKPTRR